MIVLVIAGGCGGRGGASVPSTRVQKARTISAAQAARCDNTDPNSRQYAANQCPTGAVVIDCGDGLSTNGDCDFARAVQAEYLGPRMPNGAFAQPTPGEEGRVVRTNPLRCQAYAGGWTCRSTISEVYVQQRG